MNTGVIIEGSYDSVAVFDSLALFVSDLFNRDQLAAWPIDVLLI